MDLPVQVTEVTRKVAHVDSRFRGYPTPYTLKPQPETLNLKPSTLNPQPSTLNSQP